MRISIIGGSGQLGTDLVHRFRTNGHVVQSLSHRDVEVRDLVSLDAVLTPFNPTVIINTSAFHRVDICEDQPWLAIATNVLGVANIARICEKLDAYFIHISTDYVFSGQTDRPYREDDLAEPINVYGATKLAGELLAIDIWAHTLIVRTSGLFGVAGASGKGGNFVETMLRLGRERHTIRVVTDQVLAPTLTSDLAEVITHIIDRRLTGTLHVTSRGSCSWFEFAAAIFDMAGMDTKIEPTTTAEFGARARRPPFSVLAHDRLKAEGIPEPRPWPEALHVYLQERLVR